MTGSQRYRQSPTVERCALYNTLRRDSGDALLFLIQLRVLSNTAGEGAGLRSDVRAAFMPYLRFEH